MRAAANFAWANRQMLTQNIRRSFDETFQNTGLRWDLEVLYDIAHNIAKLEEHTLEGGKTARVCVHRKGATRAFGPGSEALPERYREIGQPVLVPGSMGTASYVLAGTNEAMRLSFGSTCHGAGRTLSRKAAVKGGTGREVLDELVARGIEVQTGSFRGLAEERPEAYKDVDQVVRVVANAGIARIVAKLEPLAVVKG
jgi:tRNA-splicing ligase RtcB